ncbi:2-hydroxyacid dehydrogenase [Azorhizobium oxalatiphilum]|uniref:2-hydroxyacid dehydrogenase n=1 Tax=Azorhizobium oxalatiphilum TaxID=980631 RepID=A0A917CF85_9HYPH|nr:2-hydroxyacid dehydrogenase [Azorhizobium oxalatiphilum]GGF87206.1 2-hydroxyacid dehydrogenase [Azorhizobium oxalatiphilum]
MAPVNVDLLVLIPFPPHELARLEAVFNVTYAPEPQSRADAIASKGPQFRAVLTHGTAGLTAAEMDAMPKLEIISCFGVGYDRIDVQAAIARNIIVTHGPGTNTISVADHTLALMLASVRQIASQDAAVRSGQWHEARQNSPELTGMRLGLIGYGSIAREVARRCEAGFSMTVAYHSRRKATDTAHTYYESALALAEDSDVLVVAAPATPQTRHMINEAVLNALGPQGYLINIARGSLVETDALIAALNDGRIAGAGLDVVDGEPVVPAALLKAANLVITPHSAGRSPNAVDNMNTLALRNLNAHFTGKPVETPVPECAKVAAA